MHIALPYLFQHCHAAVHAVSHQPAIIVLGRIIVHTLHQAAGDRPQAAHASGFRKQRLLLTLSPIHPFFLKPVQQLGQSQDCVDLRGVAHIPCFLGPRAADGHIGHRRTGKVPLEHPAMGDHIGGHWCQHPRKLRVILFHQISHYRTTGEDNVLHVVFPEQPGIFRRNCRHCL